MAFKFKSDDTFLINRGNVSYTISAAEAKDIVNPEGVLIPPTIVSTSSGDFINGQGLPIESEKIKLVRTTGTDVNMKLTIQNSETELDKIDSFPNDIESDEYIPITTTISNIESTGNEYTFTFLAVNYDIGLFSVGDFVVGNGQYKGEVTDITDGKMTVESDDEGWKSMINKRIEYDVTVDGQEPITATGKLVSYNVDSSSQVTCIISDVTGLWIDSYNNRSQSMKFYASAPRGGYEVDANGITFYASPFDMRDVNDTDRPNSVLKLQKVFWRLNGTEFFGSVADGTVPQSFEAPASALYQSRDLTNSITVTYKSGNYRETSERYLFKSDVNPRTGVTTVEILNRIVGYQDDVTSLGL